MFQYIPYVTSGLTLIAFAIAAASWVYTGRLKNRAKAIEAAPPDQRVEMAQTELDYFHVDTRGLTKEQQFRIAMEQIHLRRERSRLFATVSVLLAVALAVISIYASKYSVTTEEKDMRNTAIVLGYDSAFALAMSKEGKPVDQLIASIDKRLDLLGLQSIRYPSNPMGEQKDAKPAASYAQKVSGALEAIGQRELKAFQLGWLGVIETNSPGNGPQGFSVKKFAVEAGFEFVPSENDAEILQKLVDRARKN